MMEGVETTAEPLQMRLCVSSYHAGGNVEDSLLPSPWKPHLSHWRRGRTLPHSESGVWIIPHYLRLTTLLAYNRPLTIQSWWRWRAVVCLCDDCSSNQVIRLQERGVRCKHLHKAMLSVGFRNLFMSCNSNANSLTRWREKPIQA